MSATDIQLRVQALEVTVNGDKQHGSLQSQLDMIWRHVRMSDDKVERLETAVGPLPNDRGTQFVITVTLDEVVVRWTTDGQTASLMAEDAGAAIAARLGFILAGSSHGVEEKSQSWRRPT